MSCYHNGDFVKFWEENMNALGFWVPSGAYDSFIGISGMIQVVASAVEVNPGITVSEALIGSSMGAAAGYLIAVGAAAWVGGAIGSIAVATGRSLSCGATIADAMWIARDQLKIYGAWLEAEFIRHPEYLRAH